MTTRVSVGLDNSIEGYRCGQEAIRSALATVSNPALALLITSHSQPEQVLKGVTDTLGSVPLIGTTSVGEYSHQGYVEGGAGVMLIQTEQIQFYPLSHQRGWFREGKLFKQLHGISKDGLGSPYHHRMLMLFPDDHSMNLDNVVEKAMTETAMLYDILGGPSPTISMPPREPAVFHNGRILRTGLSGTEALSQQPFGLALANGWTPVSEPYRVTKADEKRILKIDGCPAIEVYEDFLLTQGIDDPIDRLSMDVFMKYPIGVGRTGDCKVGIVTGVDSAGALKMASPPNTGSVICFLSTKPDAMITAAQRVIQSALGGLQRESAAGLLFIDCMSTAMLLGEAHAQQRAVVDHLLGDVPYLGFRSHGVLARLQGQTAGHYECSVGACLLPE